MLCKTSAETGRHFLLTCTTLESISNLCSETLNCDLDLFDHDTLLPVITDCTTIIDTKTAPKVTFPARRLCYALHIERY